jgi:putative transposase
MLRKDPFITGEYYHVYNRGVDKRIIFKLKRDYERFMILLYLCNSHDSFRLDDILNKQQKTFEEILILDKGEPLVSIGAWCLMTNVLLRQEVDGGITKFMKKLGTGYSMFFNIKYQRQGALFGGPFKAKLIGINDNYMRHLFAYIHLNPLDVKSPGWEKEIKNSSKNIKNFLDSYQYSSYLDYMDIIRAEKNILTLKNFPDYFNEVHSFKDFIKDYLATDEFDLSQGLSLRKG